MGRIVYGSLNAISVTADATQDIWSVVAATNKHIVLHGFELYSADTASEIIALSVKRITGHGTGGTSITVQAADEDSGTVTATANRTVITTQGTPDGVLMGFQWEQLGPVGHIFTPEMRPKSLAGDGFALTWDSATAATVSGWLCWEEIN